MDFASRYSPVIKKIPLKEIKVSLPQAFAQSVEKWGNPADMLISVSFLLTLIN